MVIRLVSQGKLLLKYSLLWLVLGIVALIIALFPRCWLCSVSSAWH